MSDKPQTPSNLRAISEAQRRARNSLTRSRLTTPSGSAGQDQLLHELHVEMVRLMDFALEQSGQIAELQEAVTTLNRRLVTLAGLVSAAVSVPEDSARTPL